MRALRASSWLSLTAVIVFTVALRGASPSDASTALFDYVRAPDASYSFRERRAGTLGAAQFAEFILTSQTWRGIPWKHQLYVVCPNDVQRADAAGILFITGGSWRAEYERPPTENKLPREALIFARLAEQLRAPVAVLLHVPHQPLFDGKREDQIISYTFEQFLRSGDTQWPLLLPMVKSAVRGMDCVQQVCRERWQVDVRRFTVSGASKRGWTTWLAGAVDARVQAIAPMVIDMLNMTVQMQHQLDTWGAYSEQISDYTQRGLMEQLQTPSGRLLQSIVDPYRYRERLVQPKLIILGTNDAYWPLDALNNYWNDLPSPKYVLYVPNNGHGLNDLGRITGSLSALHDHTVHGRPMPRLAWEFQADEAHAAARLNIRSDVAPRTVQAWVATSATKDFRQAVWKSAPCRSAGDDFVYDLPFPEQGYVALFGEAVYDGEILPYYLSTNVRIYHRSSPAND